MSGKITLTPLVTLLAICLFDFGGCKNKAQTDSVQIAVTNSYLRCIVEDICQGRVNILSLTPPGMCPGHFDISPAQVNALCKCKILFIFDFQNKIADSLSRIKKRGLKIYSVRAKPGMCIPQTYLTAATDICSALSLEYPGQANKYKERLKCIENRLEELGTVLHSEVKQAGLSQAPVIASEHQGHFIRWLGMRTIATFQGSDTETAADIHNILQKAKGQNIRFIIANEQQGTALANSLAKQLDAKGVLFSNFPEPASTFDELITENVKRLCESSK
ncbi:MAG: zinc ABC transporter substrate-binding protein [Sedimentisphaerales bacterium]|nr:zinc ABC transporter substrate-binding protein [Sedimentisphaerales bacterium]